MASCKASIERLSLGELYLGEVQASTSESQVILRGSASGNPAVESSRHGNIAACHESYNAASDISLIIVVFADMMVARLMAPCFET